MNTLITQSPLFHHLHGNVIMVMLGGTIIMIYFHTIASLVVSLFK